MCPLTGFQGEEFVSQLTHVQGFSSPTGAAQLTPSGTEKNCSYQAVLANLNKLCDICFKLLNFEVVSDAGIESKDIDLESELALCFDLANKTWKK